MTKKAKERDAAKRRRYILHIAENYFSNQLVFVDESAVDKRTSIRRFGWGKRGSRVYQSVPFQRGKR